MEGYLQRCKEALTGSMERQVLRKNNREMARMGLAYFKPGFHPWQIDDSRRLLPVYRDYAAASLPAAE